MNYFDLVAGSIILLLGLKGILNGFFKELFGLIGIVGGVFIASRTAQSVGEYLSDMIFKFDNSAAISFTGFLVVLALFWGVMVAAGILFKKLSAASGLGALDRILGFVLGAGKFFFIVSIIVYALYNMKSIRTTLEEMMQGSMLFPVMVETGGFIMKMDKSEPVQKLKEQQEKLGQKVEESLKSEAAKQLQEKTKEVTKTLEKNISKAIEGE